MPKVLIMRSLAHVVQYERLGSWSPSGSSGTLSVVGSSGRQVRHEYRLNGAQINPQFESRRATNDIDAVFGSAPKIAFDRNSLSRRNLSRMFFHPQRSYRCRSYELSIVADGAKCVLLNIAMTDGFQSASAISNWANS